ncbi:leucyl/phenylalanyl-tRNA--protein transferase [Halioglobus japonicus]|uniref:Leucyl/phenylalanyl-tRNA--protein transferase n=1 Tax=Halioglobus japonicus TaxID=930805 RepID=A0AAP8MIG2_9GAMM|nr:leucyl/phenylalanyl-tRNA--protein transferase [Halioglobus japonicus]PLW88084.1 leucyl/phenylalanyl-tRNA--protein transferase [Halioglobus japonicus]GHD20740.1 leucyl/phenylalanyl-tRNA--protein transferase [Halioglobus japonicus]
MRAISQLADNEPFPPTGEALDYPNGLLAVGGDLSPRRLLEAYRHGIFPWYEEPQPVLWWTPDPRSVLLPGQLHISRSLRKTLRRNRFRLSVDLHFESVMRHCAQLRGDGLGTWIGDNMLAAYCDLHHIGHAHSVEVYNPAGELVGGLYGIAIGRAYFGESMFSLEADASKVALVGLVNILTRGGFELIDCQVESEHLNSLGAFNMPRLDFEQRLRDTIDVAHDPEIWRLPATCGELL